MDKLPMTTQGHQALQEELRNLKSVERPNIVKAIAAAREHGDLSENAEYHAARERQSLSRIICCINKPWVWYWPPIVPSRRAKPN